MPTVNWIGKDKMINHYPDVPYRVLKRQYSLTKKGTAREGLSTSDKMIIHGHNLGDQLGIEDSAAKVRFGREWEQLCGNDFRYFIVFDKLKVEGALTLGEAKKWVGEL